MKKKNYLHAKKYSRPGKEIVKGLIKKLTPLTETDIKDYSSFQVIKKVEWKLLKEQNISNRKKEHKT